MVGEEATGATAGTEGRDATVAAVVESEVGGNMTDLRKKCVILWVEAEKDAKASGEEKRRKNFQNL